MAARTAQHRSPFGAPLIVLFVALSAFASGEAGPLGFDEALTLARDGPVVALARLQLEQAQATLQASRSPVSASLRTGYAYTWQDAGGLASHQGQLQPFSLDATLNVVPFGPTHDARRSAERAVETARADLQDAVAQATVDAASSYLLALRTQARLALDQRAAELADAALAHARAQRAAGDATQDAVDAAGLAALQAHTAVVSERLTLEGQLAALADLVGRPVTAVAGEPPASHDAAVAPETVERRADVLAAALALEAARAADATAVRQVLPTASTSAQLQGGDGSTVWSAGVGYATTSFQPTLSASVDPTVGSGQGTTTVLDGTRFALSVTLSVPLDAGVSAGLQSARLAVQAAEQRLTRTRQQAALAIATARRTLASASAGAQLASRQRDNAAAAAARAEERFTLGVIAEPELERARLEAQRAALDASSANDMVLERRLELAHAAGGDPMEVF